MKDLLNNEYNLSFSKIVDFYKIVYSKNQVKKKLNSILIDDDQLTIIAFLETLKKNDYKLNIIDLGAGFGKWFFLFYLINNKDNVFFYTAVEALKKRKEQFFKICKKNLFNTQNVNWINKVINFEKKPINFYHGDLKNWYGHSISINKHHKFKNFINLILNKPHIKKILPKDIILPKEILDKKYDLALIDLQGLEYKLFENSMNLIKKNIKYLIIGTHNENTEITPQYYDHNKLVNFLKENKFEIMFDYDQNTKKKYKDFSLDLQTDGIIYTKNNAL